MIRHLVGAESGRTDRVTAVIIPMDGATRIPVRRGIDVQLWDREQQQARPIRLIRNLDGQAALLNEEADQEFTFRIGTERSYYRGPLLTTFNPAVDGTAHVVALERRPDAPFDDVATLVRGVVVRPDPVDAGKTVPVDGSKVSVSGAEITGHQFPVTTDRRGSFALIVNIRRPGPDETPTVEARLRFEKDGAPSRTLDVTLTHGRTHVLSAPVDLEGNGPVRFTHE
ncbi:hypothetical protein [Kocuria rosea]|uniref:Uncharacterized protein n=1 Tax=Kocuria rosea subsp. polaris TaxID=136273 RepID=A0A0A6VSD7_KOCRO|nr:hypothetical protein [Kocuria polaris]KHD96674.1 hypothetical protein GY22_14575 [Kocuria polaris]